MNEYIKLAKDLEGSADENSISLEKLASLCLLYEYIHNDSFSIEDSPELIKSAQMLLDEEELAVNLGIELGIQALTESGAL